MDTENKHWRNKVEHITAKSYEELVELLNSFYKNRFVIATQIFPNFEGTYFIVDAIVYYKISPEEQEAEK